MLCELRVQYPGGIYHLMNPGDRREDIFQDDHNRHRFLKTLGETCENTGRQVHAYCLMSNHFHLVVETPQPNLVARHEVVPAQLYHGGSAFATGGVNATSFAVKTT